MSKNKKVQQKENKEEIIEILYHIYDFLIRCKINRSQHEVLIKKYESLGLKTSKEWEVLTKMKMVVQILN